MDFTRVDLNDDCWLLTGKLSAAEADDLLAFVRDSADLERRRAAFGRVEPRATAWFGIGFQARGGYRIRVECPPMPQQFDSLIARLSLAAGSPFNGALVNEYASGDDSVAWHHDREPHVADPDPVIASLSLGAARTFSMKPQTGHVGELHNLELGHGDVILMCGKTQHQWLHQVPKTKRPVGRRVCVTFRNYRAPGGSSR
jgi:alkylated DNA repair dioxygenase AlkB